MFHVELQGNFYLEGGRYMAYISEITDKKVKICLRYFYPPSGA